MVSVNTVATRLFQVTISDLTEEQAKILITALRSCDKRAESKEASEVYGKLITSLEGMV